VGNAVKFTPEGGRITLSLKRLQDGDPDFCTLEIKVSDTGIGIPKEHQGKLFDSFMQVDSGITRKYGGTGLGLAISKRIVEMMHGHIGIESEPGKGSTFTFTIRAKIGTSRERTEDKNAENVIQTGNFEGKRILLVEDVEINREIVITILEPLGLKITEAEDGRKAFELFKANPGGFDLIFMDIHMPVTDGFEATKLIRDYEANLRSNEEGLSVETSNNGRRNNRNLRRQIPIIAMTANVFRDDIEHCLAVGMDGHIGKPLDFGAVMSVLNKYLSD